MLWRVTLPSQMAQGTRSHIGGERRSVVCVCFRALVRSCMNVCASAQGCNIHCSCLGDIKQSAGCNDNVSSSTGTRPLLNLLCGHRYARIVCSLVLKLKHFWNSYVRSSKVILLLCLFIVITPARCFLHIQNWTDTLVLIQLSIICQDYILSVLDHVWVLPGLNYTMS